MDTTELALGSILVLSALAVILVKKPVYSGLSFLVTLLTLSALYLHLSAEFIAVMQILVYAGAILVIFMFVIVLFQDAHAKIAEVKAKSFPPLIAAAAFLFIGALIFLGRGLIGLPPAEGQLLAEFGSASSLGRMLFLDFFFPFEAVTLLLLIAVVGAVYIGKKERA